MTTDAFVPSAPAGDLTAATLMAWFSPAFPVGGFAYSQGLESAVADGLVVDEVGMAAWIDAVLTRGAGWSDAVLLALAHRAAISRDAADLDHVVELAAALAPSRERLAESLGQGEAFLRAVDAGWRGATPAGTRPRTAYSVAAGAASGHMGFELRATLIAYLTGYCGALIGAGLRLGLCGQSGGVRVLATLGPTLTNVAERACSADEADFGGCGLGADIASMRHETLKVRLFLS